MRKNFRPSTLEEPPIRYNWAIITQNLIKNIVSWDGHCRLCGSSTEGSDLCCGCWADLPWRSVRRERRIPYVDETFVCFDFDYPIRQLIHRAKFGRDLAYARLLGETMAGKLTTLGKADFHNMVLIPVPAARRRMSVRGFNQATEIALPISQALDIPIDVHCVRKSKFSLAQSTLSANRRRANVRGTFELTHAARAATAIVVDDVVTTGATLSAVAKTLRSGGVKRVVAWVLAAA